VGALPRVAEPAGHVAGGQRGEIPERAQAQPLQQPGQLPRPGFFMIVNSFGAYTPISVHDHETGGGGQGGDWLGGQEPRGLTRRYQLHWGGAAGGEERGEQAVGHADPGLDAEVRQRGDDPGGQRRLAAEVTGRPARAERAHTRLYRLDVRAELRHRADHPLVPARRFPVRVRAP
jgi:hypothetical protein